MKIILLFGNSIEKCPPVLSLINVLLEMNHEVYISAINIPEAYVKQFQSLQIICQNIDIDYKTSRDILGSLGRVYLYHRAAWKFIDAHYDENTILWIVSDLTIKKLGKKILRYRYILHFLELSQKIYLYPAFRYLTLNAHLYCEQAQRVVQSEYNRAHICKAWWRLTRLPAIFPNKPYNASSIPRNAKIRNCHAKRIIESLAEKKIILYQGILGTERPMESFIKAVDRLGSAYAFVIMTSDQDCYQNVESSNYYYIPFVAPPYHLEITSHAYIGILSYVPTDNVYSRLNALYCAPNKVYEYAQFGIPMIGNDNPGLKYMFRTNDMGFCAENLDDVGEIIDRIREIETNYDKLARNALRFYESVDLKKAVKEILE